MHTRHAFILTLAAAVLGAPAAAGAQSDPDRVRTVVRTHVAEPHGVLKSARVKGAYQGGEGRREQTERMTKTLDLGASGELDISNLSGDITVKRGGGSEATIEAVKVAYAATDEEAREMLKLVTVQITERARRGEVRTVYGSPEAFRSEGPRRHRNFNVSVNYNVSAPAGTRLVVKTLSGDVTVTDITGELALLSTSGDVRITNAERIASAKSTSGDVEIVNARLDSSLEAASVSGDIVLRKTRAPRCDLGTVSGNVVMADVECERAEAHSLSGDVTYEGPLARNGRYEFNSHSGSVRLTITGTVGFEVEANTFSGTVTVNPPLKMTGATPASSPGRRNRSISGVHGDGSAVLDITTFSGSVMITKR